MAISLSSITKGLQRQAPRMVVYGSHKIGKSTFAASAPNPIFIQTEDGLTGINTNSFPLATSYQDVLDALTVLATEDHGFQTVVIDSLDWLEPLIWSATAAQHKQSDIESFGYGKGYMLALEQWSEFLAALNYLRTSKGMAVILLAHHTIKRFDAPDSEPYDRYQIKLHDRASAKVQEWADVIGFANHRVVTKDTDVGFNQKHTRALGTGERLLYLQEQPSFMAGNRFGLPASVKLDWTAFLAAMPTHN
ncbi:MAG: ATP-binding protein [Thiolinea sp.]